MSSTLDASHAQVLERGAEALGLALGAAQVTALLAYLRLLDKWNKAYNLTAVRALDEMVPRHLLDSLSVAPVVAGLGEHWLDVGSGGGMPGIPLAILFPQRHFTLLDANGKKTRFLTQVQLDLRLPNVAVTTGRAEAFQAPRPFDGICSRAFAGLADFVGWTRHLGDAQTHWLAMKGQFPDAELRQLPEDFRLQDSRALQVPGCQAERHLLILRRIL